MKSPLSRIASRLKLISLITLFYSFPTFALDLVSTVEDFHEALQDEDPESLLTHDPENLGPIFEAVTLIELEDLHYRDQIIRNVEYEYGEITGELDFVIFGKHGVKCVYEAKSSHNRSRAFSKARAQLLRFQEAVADYKRRKDLGAHPPKFTFRVKENPLPFVLDIKHFFAPFKLYMVTHRFLAHEYSEEAARDSSAGSKSPPLKRKKRSKKARKSAARKKKILSKANCKIKLYYTDLSYQDLVKLCERLADDSEE